LRRRRSSTTSRRSLPASLSTSTCLPGPLAAEAAPGSSLRHEHAKDTPSLCRRAQRPVGRSHRSRMPMPPPSHEGEGGARRRQRRTGFSRRRPLAAARRRGRGVLSAAFGSGMRARVSCNLEANIWLKHCLQTNPTNIAQCKHYSIGTVINY
jgi:hypothetical protein